MGQAASSRTLSHSETAQVFDFASIPSMSGSSRTFRVFALRLTALALLVNALVPAGFMLHPTEGAGLTMVLCPAQSPLPGYADDSHMQSAEATGLLESDGRRCVFSQAG